MKTPTLSRSLSLFVAATFSIACLGNAATATQPPPQAITLDAPTGWELQTNSFDGKGHASSATPANFRRLGEATMGQQAELHSLTLRFAETAKLTGLKTTADFRIEQGGSCVSGNVYERGNTCTLLIRFTPQGPGRRLGSLTVSNSSSPEPMSFGLGGYGYAPALSFIPAVIQTVPATYPSNVGLLSGAQNLAVDGGDRLYMADTLNGVVRMMDSSGNIMTIWGGNGAPIWGIAVDSAGEAWVSEPLGPAPYLGELFVIPYAGAAYLENGTIYAGGCRIIDPTCSLSDHLLYSPGPLSFDPNDTLFLSEFSLGAAMIPEPVPWQFVGLYNFSTNHSTLSPGAFAVDANDNLYSADLTTPNTCRILVHDLHDAEYLSPGVYHLVTGGSPCGFSGDGGRAGNAEISTKIGQIAFDLAGNMYFSDTGNQRVRRIDYSTGIIRTIAGNGTVGYGGDGGQANSATLSTPTGVAVDSQGQVYIISSATVGGPQVVRKVTAQGMLYFGNQARSIPSAVHLMKITNTGNSGMVLSNFAITGATPTDFVVDPVTTSCGIVPGSTLAIGATCTLGIIFTPAAAGARSATITLADNTVTNSNTILLKGTGTLPSATVKITSPTSGASFTSATAITLTATVTSASGPAPTGTVQFQRDGANYGTPVTLSSGSASRTVTGSTVATHTLGAIYSGDANYAPTGPVTLSVTVTAVRIGIVISVSAK